MIYLHFFKTIIDLSHKNKRIYIQLWGKKKIAMLEIITKNLKN